MKREQRRIYIILSILYGFIIGRSWVNFCGNLNYLIIIDDLMLTRDIGIYSSGIVFAISVWSGNALYNARTKGEKLSVLNRFVFFILGAITGVVIVNQWFWEIFLILEYIILLDNWNQERFIIEVVYLICVVIGGLTMTILVNKYVAKITKDR